MSFRLFFEVKCGRRHVSNKIRMIVSPLRLPRTDEEHFGRKQIETKFDYF